MTGGRAAEWGRTPDHSVWTAEGPGGIALVVTRMSNGKWVPAVPTVGARGPELDTRTAAQRACEWMAGNIADDAGANLAALLRTAGRSRSSSSAASTCARPPARAARGAGRRQPPPAEAVALVREQAAL
jgi:hypothetical protein